ncbi:MAG TPA: ThuA domain-containing protein [Abditibacteriaceae bacterium]|jgi:trehalose utilization protein
MPVKSTISATVWSEFRHEKRNEQVRALYPNGMHEAIAEGLRESGAFKVQTATLDEPEHGLTQQVLDETDVLIWWGHIAHNEVQDEVVERVYRRVLAGMGLIVLHSALMSKIFMKLMGTTCDIKWREADEKERLWVVNPGHPIAAGLGEYIEIEAEEMYGEFFDVPAPEQLIFISWFAGGEVFRSGMTWTRGQGKIFYFRPGHETYPTYFNPEVRRVIANAARYVAEPGGTPPTFGNVKPLEKI